MADSETFLLAGVMGYPVMHSRSPLMHNFWFEKKMLNGRYLPLSIKPSDLESGLRALSYLGFSGCNLTIPHKEEALKVVDDCDDVARKIGAINCVTVNPNNSLTGTNSDWYGFTASLNEEHPNWNVESGAVVVIGAGGAARAVCYGLLSEGVSEIRLINRTKERAEVLAHDFGRVITPVDWRQRHESLSGANLLVNTTSLGMAGQPSLDLCLDLLPTESVVYDLVYTPLETSLLFSAGNRGNKTINGLGMLLHQAVLAWKSWFNIVPEVSNELRQLILNDIHK
jgi:shikimate dehydrogenase